METWDERYRRIEKVRMTGTAALNGTLDNTAVSDNGDGTVDIAITGHGLTEGSTIIISGTTNYDGVHTLLAVGGADAITITATYVAETPAGSETYAVVFKPSYNAKGWKLVETRFHLSGVSAAESITYTLDADAGAAYDALLDSNALSGLTDDVIVWSDGDKRRYFDDGDAIVFGYTNTNAETWGLEIIYRVHA